MKISPHGVLPAMITPIGDDGKPNEKMLRNLINHLLNNGVHGIFAIGTTGEFYALSDDEYKEVLEITVDEVNGRAPVYAGANHITTRGSIRLAQIAEEAGVDALSVLTPMFISPNQQQIYEHFATVAANTSLPILLYNNKPKTNVDITPATVTRLAEVKNIIGIKDSTGDLTNTGEYIRLTKGKDFHVFVGRDTLIHGALCYGASGAVAGCANVAPRLCANIYDKYMAGDIKGSLEDQFTLAPLRIAFTIGTFPAVIKESLELLGVPTGKCFAPVSPLNSEEREQVKKILGGMGLLA